MRIQQEGGCLQARKRALARIQTYRHPDLQLQASRTIRNKCLLFKPPRLRYFVLAAQADKDCPDKICQQVFIATLFIIAKTWKQPTYSSVGQWMNELVHLCYRILFGAKREHAIKSLKDMYES